MSMLTPYDLDLRVAWHQAELMHEAEVERLAKQLRPRRSTARVRAAIAAVLYAVANRLEPSLEVRAALRLATEHQH